MKIISIETIEHLKTLIRNRNSYLDIKEVLDNLEDNSQDVKLDESQAPKIVEKGMQSKRLGDVSGCPDILNNVNLLEELSSLEHEQWMYLIKYIQRLKDDDLNYFITCGWNNKLIPYEQLTEEDKEKDRVFARKVLYILNKEINLDNNQEVKSSILNEEAQDSSDGIANRSNVEQTPDNISDILKELKELLHKGKRSQIHEFEIRDIINKYKK